MYMKIFNYFEFINEEKEDILLPIFLSNEFIEKISKIDSPISSHLLSISKRGSRPDSKYTLIDVGSSEDTISYSDSGKLNDFLSKIDLPLYGKSPDKYMQNSVRFFPENPIWNVNRVEIKVGRFIRKLFSQKDISLNLSDSEIENFVNKWKSLYENPNFVIYEGDDIKEGYRTNNYESMVGPLGNSCMNDETYLVSFYSYCPTAKLLVLENDESKVLGRALLWEDSDGRKIMDRIYYSLDKYYFSFIRWADENDYYYKKNNSNHFNSPFMKRGTTSYLKSKVKIPNCFEFADEGFPYFDTFIYATGDWAQNYQPTGIKRYFILNDTEGSYNEEEIIEDIHGNLIENDDDYIWSETQGGYIKFEDAYKVEYNNSEFPEHSFDDWIEVDYLNDPKNKFVKVDNVYYKKSDCVFSKKENKWIWIPDAKKVDDDWVSIYD